VFFHWNFLKIFLTELEENKYTGKEDVTIDGFGNALEWFGPLESGLEFLERVSYL
jgi:hypothetical protein